MRLFRGLWLLLGCLLSAPQAISGAWLRDTGEAFVALESRVRGTGPAEGSLYLEYGAGPRVTLGLDATRRSDGAAHALGFARLPLLETGTGARMAVELGAGGHLYRGSASAMGRAMLQYGHGLPGGGWIGIGAGAEHRRGLGAPLMKLDAVAGLPVRGPWQPMIRLETFYKDGYGPGSALTPSMIYRDRRGRRWLSGIELRSGGGERSVGITFGFWRMY